MHRKHNSWPRIYKQYPPPPQKKGWNPNICNFKSISKNASLIVGTDWGFLLDVVKYILNEHDQPK